MQQADRRYFSRITFYYFISILFRFRRRVWNFESPLNLVLIINSILLKIHWCKYSWQSQLRRSYTVQLHICDFLYLLSLFSILYICSSKFALWYVKMTLLFIIYCSLLDCWTAIFYVNDIRTAASIYLTPQFILMILEFCFVFSEIIERFAWNFLFFY